MASWVNICEVVWPIGSIYMSFSSTSPATILGGTWTQLTNTFLYASTSSGSKGGSSSHAHQYGVQYASYYYSMTSLYNADEQLLTLRNNGTWNSPSVSAGRVNGSYTNSGLTGDMIARNNVRKQILANTDNTSTLPPYTTVYCWRRTA